MKKFLSLNLSDVFIMLINVKMPTIVGILIFMSRVNLLLSLVEHEKKFYNLGPGLASSDLFSAEKLNEQFRPRSGLTKHQS